jgi:hypothetical protein
MTDFLTRLWSPPTNLTLRCPDPPPGVEGTNPIGYYDPVTISSAYAVAATTTVIAAFAVVLICYLGTRTSLGPRFLTRWRLSLVGAGMLGLLAPMLVLTLWPTRALAGTCETNPSPFAAPLPWSEVMAASASGALWALIAFVVLSLLLTQTIGWAPWAGGFFHNRGCPWPRYY